MAVADNPTGDIYQALRHPLRRQILAVLWKTKGPVSPSEISDLLSVPLSNVSYHVRLLNDAGRVVTLAASQPVRGSLEHFYEVNDQELASYPWAVEAIEETEVPLPLPQPRQPPDEETFNRYAELLTPRERSVVEYRRGWNGRPRTSREAVAKAMKTNAEQVRLIERGALNKIERARYRDETGGD